MVALRGPAQPFDSPFTPPSPYEAPPGQGQPRQPPQRGGGSGGSFAEPWTPQHSQVPGGETAVTAGSSEESDDEGSLKMWRELSAEMPLPEDRLASAAAAAAAALAHGAPLLADTADGMRPDVPGLLTVQVRLPAQQQVAGEQQAGKEQLGLQLDDAPAAATMLQQQGVDSGAAPMQVDLASCSGSSGNDNSATGGGLPPGSRCAAKGHSGCHGGSGCGCGGGCHGGCGCPSTLCLPLGCASTGGRGGCPGSCVFTLSVPASAAERLVLAGFADQLGCQLERARHHLAKQQLEGSLDDLSQALARGDEMEGVAQATAAGLALPAVPEWRSGASAGGGSSRPGSPRSCTGSCWGVRSSGTDSTRRRSLDSTGTSR